MGMVTVYLLYLLISVVLTIVTATILARSGRIFLTRMLGGDEALGQAISRLLAVGFYLLNLGFVILGAAWAASTAPSRPSRCWRPSSARRCWSSGCCTWSTCSR
jgi:hypothetical protein